MEYSEEAKSCPFCGCKEIRRSWGWPEEDPWQALECNNCEVMMTAGDYTTVLEKWNRTA